MADNMIQLKGAFIRKELPAAAAITPGDLVERDSSNEFAVHSSAAGSHGSCFAVEDELQGLTITDDYSAADRVQVNYQVPGNEVMARLSPDLAGTPVTIGAFLESNGDGDLRLISGSDTQSVGVALEDVDLTNSGDVAAPIKIEIT